MSVTHASIWLKLISKISNTLDIEYSLLNSPVVILLYRFHFRSTDLAVTNPIHRISGQFVNKPAFFISQILMDSVVN